VGKNGRLVAVIVTFNRLDALQVTLGHAMTKGFYRVVVVDNCSTDGTRQWLGSVADEALVIIHADANRGGAGGFNIGFSHVTEQIPEADWLVCFDDDAFPESDVVSTFDALDIPEDVGSLAAAVYLPDGRVSEMNRPSRNPFWHLRAFLGAGLKGRHGFHIGDQCYQMDETMEIDASSFVGFFIRLSLIRSAAIGLPRTELFIYADDIIYVLELRKAGYRHLFVSAITFQHDCQTLIAQQDVYHPLWKVYYTFRNRLEMYRVASGFFYPFILLLKIPKAFLTVRFYEKHERRVFLSITAKAVVDGVTRNYSRTHEEVVALSQDRQ
jgi:rhamnopyranosyl-N-acetylglucosaminyl-diphospho-decaprenol beta-1,3/1,4-galactofuranosyltransferase